MVRRRSTVRFRNGAPAKRNNSNSSNSPWGPFRGPSSSHIGPRRASVCLRSAELCGLGGSLMDLLNCAEDHRRGALDGPAHQVHRAVAAMYLGELPCDRRGLAVRAGGHVTQVRTLASACGAGSNSELRTSASPRSPASMMAQEWCATSRHSMASACCASGEVPGAIELMQARGGQAGRVADVVQPGGGFQEIGVGAEDWCQAACPVGDALDVGPAAGQGPVGEVPGPVAAPTVPACSCSPG